MKTKSVTHAMIRLAPVPHPVRMNATRTSLSARANPLSLSYFSYTTGTRSMNRDRNMPAIDMKSAKPDRPALGTRELRRVVCRQARRRTWTYAPFGLKGS